MVCNLKLRKSNDARKLRDDLVKEKCQISGRKETNRLLIEPGTELNRVTKSARNEWAIINPKKEECNGMKVEEKKNMATFWIALFASMLPIFALIYISVVYDTEEASFERKIGSVGVNC